MRRALVKDIINEAKMANAIVQEVLAFVRPVACRSIARRCRCAVERACHSPTARRRAAASSSTWRCRRSAALGADQHQLTQVFCNLLINAYEALEGAAASRSAARLAHTAADGALLPDGHQPCPP
jgi:C4-dicarboxylate-specific signal transduction histidine kinase